MSDARAPRAPVELVLALVHEVANLVGAVRLHVYLLDDEMSPRASARSNLELDALCARASALLAHVRPLLGEVARDDVAPAPRELLGSVRELMVEQGALHVRVADDMPVDLPSLEAEREVIHHLLQSLVFAACEASGANGSIVLAAARCDAGRVALVVEDDGAAEGDPARWRSEALRGRPLVFAVAEAVLARRSGSLQVERADGRTRVSLVLPVRGAEEAAHARGEPSR